MLGGYLILLVTAGSGFFSNSESENCWFRVFEGKQSQRIMGSGYFMHFRELPTNFQDLVGSSLTF